MNKRYRIRQGLFGRWYIVHPYLDDAAWSGSRWVSVSEQGVPTGGVQVCNFNTAEQAQEYANANHILKGDRQ
jgi:hypothetical protein